MTPITTATATAVETVNRPTPHPGRISYAVACAPCIVATIGAVIDKPNSTAPSTAIAAPSAPSKSTASHACATGPERPACATPATPAVGCS